MMLRQRWLTAGMRSYPNWYVALANALKLAGTKHSSFGQDAVDRYVIGPTLELKDIIKTIQKTIVKRNHKQIDYDRHRASLNKLKAKEQRSFSEEKQIYKIEQQLETATQDYEYLNDMLKQELPRFFHMKAQFIEPVFNSLYFLQCKIYGMIYARCYELANANAEHFPTLNMPIEDGYNWRRSQRDARAEMENLDLLKSGGKAWLSVSGGQNNSKLTLKERAALRQQENGMMSSPPPPAYGAAGGVTLDSTPMNGDSKEYGYGAGAAGYGGGAAAAAATGYCGHQRSTSRSGPSPPPPPPIANKAKTQYVVALYDYDAQADGDLSFKKDDKIEVIERTADQNDWWTGRLRGQTGIFPGNYVAEL